MHLHILLYKLLLVKSQFPLPPHLTIVLETETTFTQFLNRIDRTNKQKLHKFYAPALAVHNAHRTLPAPAPHSPTFRRMCHLRSADLQPHSPRWAPALICRGALSSATPDGDHPRHARGAAHNQGAN